MSGNRHFKKAVNFRSPSWGSATPILRDSFLTSSEDLHAKANAPLTKKPGHPDGLAAKALALIDDGSYEQARELLVGAIRKNPFHSQSRFALAKLAIKDDKYYAARRQLEIAVKNGSKDQDVHDLLGNVNAYIQRNGVFEEPRVSASGRRILSVRIEHTPR